MRTIALGAVFFDFDGVLVESTVIKNQAFLELYAPYGADVLDQVLAHHAAHEGISRFDKIRHCHREYLGQTLGDEELAELSDRYSKLVEAAVVECPPVAGSLEFLDAVHGRLPVFVVSGTPEDELRRIVAARRIGHLLTAVYGSPTKKDVIIRSVLAAQGLAAAETVFVGDAMTDYRAAEATGMPFVGRLVDRARNPFPDGTQTLADLSDLAALLGI